MNQRAVRTKLSILLAALSLTVVATACGGSTGSTSSAAANDPTTDTSAQSPSDSATTGKTDTADTTATTGSTPASDTTASNDKPAKDTTAKTSAPDGSAFLKRTDTRAMWLWNESPTAQQILDNTGGAQDQLLSFAKAPQGQAKRSINRLFFASRGYSNADRFAQLRPVTYDPLKDADKQAKLHAFLKRANAQGMAVEYLDGQAIWVATDANANAPMQICKDVVAFNEGTDDPTARFAGIHLDIEPHTVRSGPYASQWWENRLPNGYNADWTQRWEDILKSCRQTLDAYQAKTGQHMTLSSDIGTDYAHYNKPILEFLNRKNGPLDYLTIMNYFDNRPNKDGDPSYFYGKDEGGQIVGGVIENLAAWDQLKLMFAFETGPASIAEDAQSFHQEGYKALYKTVDTLLSDYGTAQTIGVGIHHYSPDSYRDLKP